MISIKQISYVNNIGQRPQLEDAIYPPPGDAREADNLFMVCDGVGGENMGEEASRIACEEFAYYIHQQNPPVKGLLTSEYISGAQLFVLQKMAQFAEKRPEAIKMSTTLTMAYLGEKSVSVAWCGDSRIYHIRKGNVLWRSSDHSMVANLIKHGEITEEEAHSHPQRNIILRSLSASGEPSEIDVHQINNIAEGDYILLCTDGVLERINEDILKKILFDDRNDPTQQFMAYCKDKTRDNFSLYLLKLSEDVKQQTGKPGRLLVPILMVLAVVALLVGLFKADILGWINGPAPEVKPLIRRETKNPVPLPTGQKGRSPANVPDTTANNGHDTSSGPVFDPAHPPKHPHSDANIHFGVKVIVSKPNGPAPVLGPADDGKKAGQLPHPEKNERPPSKRLLVDTPRN